MLGKTANWSSPATKYGMGLKKLKYAIHYYGMDTRVFNNKDSPDYKPSYGNQFTARQRMILNQEMPINQIRRNEISLIIHKAEAMGDEENAAIARNLYEMKLNEGKYQFSMNHDEAKNTLQALTPWKIDWSK